MNKVTITADTLRVEPTGLDRLWSFTRRLDIPLAHVRGATFDPGYQDAPKGRRGPGLHVPGKWSGRFTHDGESSFWNVTADGRTVVISLRDERYQRLVLTVDEPRALVDRVNAVTG